MVRTVCTKITLSTLFFEHGSLYWCGFVANRVLQPGCNIVWKSSKRPIDPFLVIHVHDRLVSQKQPPVHMSRCPERSMRIHCFCQFKKRIICSYLFEVFHQGIGADNPHVECGVLSQICVVTTHKVSAIGIFQRCYIHGVAGVV